MKLFQEFFAKPHLRPGEAHFPVSPGTGCWWNDPDAVPLAAARGFNIALRGELQFQAEIAAAVGGRCAEGHSCQVPAQLVLAATASDPMAIGVEINSRPVGWLASEVGPELRPQLTSLNPDGKPVTCKAKIVGGWERGPDDRGYFGVRLSLALPLKVHKAVSPKRSKRHGHNETGGANISRADS